MSEKDIFIMGIILASLRELSYETVGRIGDVACNTLESNIERTLAKEAASEPNIFGEREQ